MRLGVTVDLTDKASVLTHVHCGVRRQPSLEDGPVRGALCEMGDILVQILKEF